MEILKLLPVKTVLAILGGSLLIWTVMDYLCDTGWFGMQPDDFGKCSLLIPGWIAGCILVAALARKKGDKTDEESS